MRAGAFIAKPTSSICRPPFQAFWPDARCQHRNFIVRFRLCERHCWFCFRDFCWEFRVCSGSPCYLQPPSPRLLPLWRLLACFSLLPILGKTSARFGAMGCDLKICAHINSLRKIGEPIQTELWGGRVFSDYDLILPKNYGFCIVVFRTDGRGQNQDVLWVCCGFSRAWINLSLFDPKGELSRTDGDGLPDVFTGSIWSTPAQSDRWNFMPQCRGRPSLPIPSPEWCSPEARAKTNQDPFWGNAEQVLLTAVLLHLAECYHRQLRLLHTISSLNLTRWKQAERIERT